MAKKKSKKEKELDRQIDAEMRAAMDQPWMQMRTGIIIISISSIFLAIFTAWQLIPSEGFWKAIGWGLVFGGAMWAIFIGGVLLNRFLRRKKDTSE